MARPLGFALLGLFSHLNFAVEAATSKFNEFTVESEAGKLTFFTCHTLPAGFGFFPQCGTRIKDNETKKQCMPYLLDETSSAHEDISSRDPCEVKHGKIPCVPCNK